MLKTSNLTLKRKQFCTLREGNLGNVLLTSRIRLKHFYQCSEPKLWMKIALKNEFDTFLLRLKILLLSILSSYIWQASLVEQTFWLVRWRPLNMPCDNIITWDRLTDDPDLILNTLWMTSRCLADTIRINPESNNIYGGQSK